jgi:hypothetical protein
MNKVSIRSSLDTRWNEHRRALVNDCIVNACRRITLSTTLQDADYWRERAKEARRQSEQMSRPDDKRELLDIARAYERLAKLAAEMKIVRE